MFDQLTTVTQGSIGLSYAIAFLSKKGYTVSVPLVDNQSYDLVCEINDTLKKVQVKTTKQKAKSNYYVVELRSIRANRTKNTIHNFNSNSCDYLIVVTELSDIYFIPTSDIKVTCALTLNEVMDKYKEKL